MTDKPQNISQPKDYKLIVEKDVKIPMRDGAILYADVFRPDGGDERVPAIMNIGPYQKDRLWIPPEDLEEKANPYLAWETANPSGGVRAATRCVRVDARGSGKSPGRRIRARTPKRSTSTTRSNGSRSAVVLGQHRHARHLVPRGLSVAGGEPAAAVAEGHHSLGRPRRSLPRPDLPRRHLRDGVPATGSRRTWRITYGEGAHDNPDAFNNNMLWEHGSRTASTPSSGACAARAGIRSTCRSTASATGPASACTCAATSKVS